MSGLGSVQASPLKPNVELAAAEPREDACSTVSPDMDSESVYSAKTGASVADNAMVTQKEIDEEDKLADEAERKEQEELKKRKEIWLHMERDSKEERYKRLQCLLMKSNMYTEYLLSRMERQREEERKRRERNIKMQARGKQKKLGTEAKAAAAKEEETGEKAGTVKTEQSETANGQKSTDSTNSDRRTRQKKTLPAPVRKSRASSTPNTPEVNSPLVSAKTNTPGTPGKDCITTPVIESAKTETVDDDNNNTETNTHQSKQDNGDNATVNNEANVDNKSPEKAAQGEIKMESSPEAGKENACPAQTSEKKRLSTPAVEDFEECLRSYLGEGKIPVTDSEAVTLEESEQPIPDYSTSKRGRKRKNADYNEQSPQGARLITHCFKPINKKRKLEEELPMLPAAKVEEKKVPTVVPEMDLYTGYPDIEPDGTITRPALLSGGILRRYQIEGLNWLKVLFENGVNGILADEMGLGKTIQCVSLVCQILTMGARGPFLVVAPLSTLPNWYNEFRRFAPRMPVLLYHGKKDERMRLYHKIAKCHTVLGDANVRPVVITSYEIAMLDRPSLSQFNWTYMIVDEGHRIKNRNCRLVRELKMYKSSHRLLLTGTPLQNNLQELWSLLNFLLPEIFDDLGSFETWFDVSLISDESADEAIIEEEKKNNILSMLHQILTPFMLRRVKSDVDIDIPPKKELLVFCPLSDVQREFYETTVDRTIFNKMKNKYESVEPEVELDAKGRPKRGNKRTSRSVCTVEKEAEVTLRFRNMLMQLRKVCNHPYLIEYPLDPTGNYLMNEDLVNKCGKMMILDKMLTELFKEGHKVLIFSQMTQMMDILQDFLYIRGINFCRLDGSCNIEDRQASMHQFNNDPDYPVFLLSTRAGGLGVNLVAADTVIIYDSDWNPQCDLQAQDRCHRIGQTKPVMVYRFVTANTIDQRIVERAQAKRKLEKMVIHKGKFKSGINNFSSEMKPLNPEELMELLKSKDHSEVVEKTNGEVISKVDLAQLLDRSDLIREFKEKNSRNKQQGQAGC